MTIQAALSEAGIPDTPPPPLAEAETIDLGLLSVAHVGARGVIGVAVTSVTTFGLDHLEHPDDDRAMDAGQNWVEALETSAAENGPLPEQPLDNILDDEDLYAAAQTSDSDDIPVADRGSGGPGGI